MPVSTVTARRPPSDLPDHIRYVPRKLPHACAPELEHNPSPRQVLLFLVLRYPLRRVLVSICGGGHCVRLYCSLQLRSQFFAQADVVYIRLCVCVLSCYGRGQAMTVQCELGSTAGI